MSFLKKIFGVKDTKKSQDMNALRMNVDEFVQKALRGSARCRIKISQVQNFCTWLVGKLMEKGLSDSQMRKLLSTNLYAVCPDCGVRYKGEGLLNLGFWQSQRKAAFTNKTIAIERLLKGCCANENCKCRDMMMCWQKKENN